MTELKPCPFCGGRANAFPPTLGKSQLETSPKDCPGRFYSMVYCNGCGAQIVGADFDTDCRKAIDAWNRRNPEPPYIKPCRHCGANPRHEGRGTYSVEHKDHCRLYDEESAQIIAPNEVDEWQSLFGEKD